MPSCGRLHCRVRLCGRVYAVEVRTDGFGGTGAWAYIHPEHDAFYIGTHPSCRQFLLNTACRWLGDAQLAFETVVHNFDTAAFYTKWVRDLADVQDYNNATLGTGGALPDCAPFYGHGGAEADPGWGFAGWVVPLGLVSHFDDARVESMWYPHAKAYADHWILLATNHSGMLPIMSYGDWFVSSAGLPTDTSLHYTVFFGHALAAVHLRACFALRVVPTQTGPVF